MHNHRPMPAVKPVGGSHYRLLVLVPHPETRGKIRAFSAELFAAGFTGAWSFPHIAPMAVLSCALTPTELKHCAALLRTHNPGTENDYKIRSGAPRWTAFQDMSIYGPELNLRIPEPFVSLINTKALHWFTPLVLGAALANGEDFSVKDAPRPPPELEFRAAFLAQMLFKPPSLKNNRAGNGLSSIWKIENGHWLPPLIAIANHRHSIVK